MADEQEGREFDDPERRKFLDRAGKIALTVPPTIALLLAAEGRHYAFAQSGRGRGNDNGNSGYHDNGNGNGNNGNGNNGNGKGNGG
jgi:hypothetical protein